MSDNEKTWADLADLTEDERKRGLSEFHKGAKEVSEAPLVQRDRKLTKGQLREVARRYGLRVRDLDKLPLHKAVKIIDEFQPLKKKRNRGPNRKTLSKGRVALKYWLDEGKSLDAASHLAGTDPKTVLNNLPALLELIEEPKRDKWVKMILALGKEEFLGQFKESP